MWENDTFYQIPRILTVHSIHTAFHIAHDEHFSFEGEMHNFWELVFISEGKASIAKDNRIFNLGSGDIAFSIIFFSFFDTFISLKSVFKFAGACPVTI